MSWLDQKAYGTRVALRTLAFVVRAFGRTPARWALRVIAFHYVLVATAARRASRRYLVRMGQPHGFWSVFQHLLHFAEVALDRAFFLMGRTAGIDVVIEPEGEAALGASLAEGRGVLLLGAHFGSFEALRFIAPGSDAPLAFIAYFQHTQAYNDELARFGPNDLELIDASRGPVALGLELERHVGAGTMVAILADREGFGKTVSHAFLGGPVEFPSGPFSLAGTLECPVFFACATYQRPNRYTIRFRKLADGVPRARRRRQEAIGRLLDAYVGELEAVVREHPLNWFNFYDYWAEER